jgi:hypothetical protein
LAQGFGILLEWNDSSEGNMLQLMSLVYLNFHDKVLQKLHTIEQTGKYRDFIVNSVEPTEFILQFELNDVRTIQFCKVVKDKLVIGDIIELDFEYIRYFDECIYGFDSIEDGHRVRVYDIEQKTIEHFEFDAPEDYMTSTVRLEIFRTSYNTKHF